MSIATDLSTARAHLASWLAADTAVSKSQSYQMGQRSLSRADAKEIRTNIDYWQGKVNQLESGTAAGPHAVRVVPRDL